MQKITLIRTDKNGQKYLSALGLPKLMERILEDNSKKSITTFRRMYHTIDGNIKSFSGKYDIPEVLPAAVYGKDRNGNIIFRECSGLLLLKFDGLDGGDEIEDVKRKAAFMTSTVAAMAGADGRSVCILVCIANENGVIPDSEEDAGRLYRTAYGRMAPIYEGAVGHKSVAVAPSLKDSMLMTVDPAPYYNPKATAQLIPSEMDVVAHTEEMPVKKETVVSKSDSADYVYLFNIAKREVEETVRAARKDLGGKEGVRLAMITGIAKKLHAFGMPKEEAFLRLRINYITELRGDLIREILDAEYADEPEKMEDMTKYRRETRDNVYGMMTLLKSRYQFRYNMVMNYPEYHPNNSVETVFIPVDSRTRNRMMLETRMANINVSVKDVDNFLRSDYIKSYSPIMEYLYECRGKWDGTDHIRNLARTVPNLNPNWVEWFYTWFLGMVNQWERKPNRLYGNSVAPLLISGQGYNKSTFCRSLIPDELKWGYTDSLQLSEKRQVLQALSQFLLINLDEFNQISPEMQQGFLKNIIQMPNVKVKRPYASYVEELPRLASFIATSNLTDILSDPSGNRRFIGVELTSPIDVSVRPNHRQLFAQALYALDNGEKCYFDDAATREIMESNRKYQVVSAIEMFFAEYLAPAESEKEGEYMSAAAIQEYLRAKVGSILPKCSLIAFGRKLSNIGGLKNERTKHGVKYLVKKLKDA